MGWAIFWTVWTFAFATLLFLFVAEWLRFALTAPRIQLRIPSGAGWGAKFWNSFVWYDICGTPYAKANNIGSVRLRPNGKTDDYIYRTTWVQISGPAITFPIKETL